MPVRKPLATFLGMDIGSVNTRVSVFGIRDGKFCLQGCEVERTSLGAGEHIAVGVHGAVERLQNTLGRSFLKPSGAEKSVGSINQNAIDQAGLVVSAVPRIKAALVGLTSKGSLSAGLALTAKLPLDLVGAFSLADLADEPAVIDKILEIRPKMLILAGGEDGGAEEPLIRWIELVRMACRVLPDAARPKVFYAGNSRLESIVRRRLEPTSELLVLPNLQPVFGGWDDVQLHAAISRELLSPKFIKYTGLDDLQQLTGDLFATRGFALDRMMRFMSRTKLTRLNANDSEGVLAIDLGGGSTVVCAGSAGKTTAVRVPVWFEGDEPSDEKVETVYQWTAAPASREDVAEYLANLRLWLGMIPETLQELAITQSLARYRIRTALHALKSKISQLTDKRTGSLLEGFEPVFASGSVLTSASTPGQAMLMLLDGFQPERMTTFILDRFHLLPLLGLLGEAEPLLPVHLLASDAFENLGTIIPAISDANEGELILRVTVNLEAGKSYAIDIPQGSLRRLVVPPGEVVGLALEPEPRTDIGFGGQGCGTEIKVVGGTLGVIIDARGRPLTLPAKNNEDRVERLRRWLWILGG